MQKNETYEVECSLLYCMIDDVEVLLQSAATISEDHFSDQVNKRLFSFLKGKASTGKKIDFAATLYDLSVADSAASDRFTDIMAMGFRVASTTWGAAQAFLDKLELDRQRNRLEGSLNAAIKLCQTGVYKNSGELVSDVLTYFESMREAQMNSTVVFSPEELADEFYDRVANAGNKEVGIPTGFPILDQYLGGLRPNKLIIVGARPSMGKTSLALNIAEHVAFNEHKKVLFVSLEMERDDLVDRIACVHLRLDTQAMDHKDKWTESTKNQVHEVCEKIKSSQLFICDELATDVDKLISLIRLQDKLEGVDLVIIDYLQLMSSSGYKNQKVNEVSDITKKLKTLARELKKPFIVLSQLSRGLESRSEKRPTLADLRDSGSIEQDADVVILINRNKEGELEKREPDLSNEEARIIIAKQRGGPTTDNIVLGYRKEQTRFLNPKSK